MATENKKGGGNVVWMLSTFLLVGILVGLGVSSLNGDAGQTSVPSAGNQGAQQQGTPQPSSVPAGDYTVPDVDDDASMGSEDALVTMIEFSDLECPYCQRFESQVFPLIKEAFIDTGLVKFAYRDFPLSFHENAHDAAEANECAGDYDLYWEMHDKLVADFDTWTTSTDVVATFEGYAVELGMEAGVMTTCLEEETYYDEVEADIADGRAGGISGTPSFYINGELVVGALPFEDYVDQSGQLKEGFESILNRLLEEAQ